MLLPSYIGPVATRCRVSQDVAPNNATYGYTKRTYHYARDDITWLRIGVPNWYSNAASGEAATGGSGWTIAAGIEYPFTVSTVGTTCKVATWGGSTTTTAVAGATMWSDWMHCPIPRGAKFGSRLFVNITSATGQQSPFTNSTTYNGAWRDAAGGDVWDFSGTNLAGGGTMTDDGSQLDVTPLLVGLTRRPTVAIMGDSRQSGFLDTVDTNAGDAGETARTYGKHFNYLQLAVCADTIASFIASSGSGSTLRRGLAALCSHISMELGIVDLNGGASAATVEANIKTMLGMPGMVGKPLIYDLMLPLAISTDSFATTGNQTTTAANTPRNAVNTWLAGGNASAGGHNDPRGPCEFPTIPSGIWNAPGFTTDGTHPTVAGYQDIMNDGCVDPRKIVRRR
jgi:hypothetical protein